MIGQRYHRTIPTSRRHLLVVLALGGALALANPLGAAASGKLDKKVDVSAEVYEELFEVPDRAVPRALVGDARCVAIIPQVIKGAFGWGGRHGRGVLSCRQEDGGWSAPAFIRLSGASFGLQIGAEATDLVLFFMTDRSAKSLLKSEFTLGADAKVAAGPLGRSAEASTDARLQAEILSYAKSRGLFAGVSIQGSRLAIDFKRTDRYYGSVLRPEDILFGGAGDPVPASARRLQQALARQ